MTRNVSNGYNPWRGWEAVWVSVIEAESEEIGSEGIPETGCKTMYVCREARLRPCRTLMGATDVDFRHVKREKVTADSWLDG